MLLKVNRIQRPHFYKVKKSSQKITSSNFLIFYSPSSILKASVIVSKKIDKQAVKRNSLRRIIYNHLKKNYLSLNYSLLIYPKIYETNLSELDQVLSKLD